MHTSKAFMTSPDFASMLERHGLPPLHDVDDHPVHAAIAGGRQLLDASVLSRGPARRFGRSARTRPRPRRSVR